MHNPRSSHAKAESPICSLFSLSTLGTGRLSRHYYHHGEKGGVGFECLLFRRHPHHVRVDFRHQLSFSETRLALDIQHGCRSIPRHRLRRRFVKPMAAVDRCRDGRLHSAVCHRFYGKRTKHKEAQYLKDRWRYSPGTSRCRQR